jgi:hypothetical protein
MGRNYKGLSKQIPGDEQMHSFIGMFHEAGKFWS